MPGQGPIAKAVLRVFRWGFLLLAVIPCNAQQDGAPVFTLKVSANLVQVPTLVLDHDQRPLPPIDPARFRVSLDGGKRFAPTRVRVEGADPLQLAILLDISGSQRHLVGSFADAVAAMAAHSLFPQDHVSVYALNCELIRSSREIPAQPGLLSKSVEAALHSPLLREGYKKGECPKPTSVWDAMLTVAHDMSDSPARRVMLVISEGDVLGEVSFADLHHYAGVQGVALFGLSDGEAYSYDRYRRNNSDLFRDLCESTGGLVINTGTKQLEAHLEQWVTMLRNRYVVEFPQPQQLVTGLHRIQVFVDRDYLAFVSLAGVSMPLPDPNLTSDPNYLPSTAGADIPVGSQRRVPQH